MAEPRIVDARNLLDRSGAAPPRLRVRRASGGADGARSSSPAAPASSARTSATRLLDRGDEVVVHRQPRHRQRSTTSSTSSADERLHVRRARRQPATSGCRARSTRSCTSPARRRRSTTSSMPIQTLKVGSLGTHNALGLAKAKGARFMLASTSEVYGDPEVHPQPETLLGQREPDRAPRRLRRGQALRRGDDDGLPPLPRPRRAHRAHLQHLRAPDARRRRAGRVELHRAGARRASRSRSTATASRPGSFCYVDDEVRGFLALLDGDAHRPDQHRQRRRVHHARAGRGRARGHRFDVARSCSSRCRSTIPSSAGPTSPWPAALLGWEPDDRAAGGRRPHRGVLPHGGRRRSA